MVTMVQSAANWRNTHTDVDRTHSLTHININETIFISFILENNDPLSVFLFLWKYRLFVVKVGHSANLRKQIDCFR